MSQATIEEAHEAFRKNVRAALKAGHDERRELASLAADGLKWAKRAAESIASMSILLYKCLRLIDVLIDENKKLREESMQEKVLNRELARTRFHPVAKAHLN